MILDVLTQGPFGEMRRFLPHHARDDATQEKDLREAVDTTSVQDRFPDKIIPSRSTEHLRDSLGIQ